MPCRDPCRPYIHLAFTYSVDLSSLRWSELGPAPPFSLMGVFEVNWSQVLSLVCEVALRAHETHPKAVLWGIKVQVCNWWALKLSVKWKWIMLRDYDVCLGSSPHCHNVTFLETSGNIIDCRGPTLTLHLLLLRGPNAISSKPWIIVHLLPCRTPCRDLIHLNIFGPSFLQGLLYLWFLMSLIIWIYIMLWIFLV
jgi:hypothetical protein